MSELFPTTHSTWLVDRITSAPDEARVHVLARYFEPLCAYARASSLRALGEPAELVNDFLSSRLADGDYLARWSASGIPLRRWLANGLLTHARNRALAEARRARHGGSVDPAELARMTSTHATDALLALERAWAVRTVTEAHERVHTELVAEGRSSWWELFRLHGVQGMSYEQACPIAGVAPSNATNVHRAVVMRLRDALRGILEREGVRPDEIDRELALMQDLLQ
jgi:DNA-directed RNA polymerase specialized sigma24 family protein